MNSIKRTTAGIMALSVVISLASCGSKTSTKTTEPQTADKVLNKAYTAVDIGDSIPVTTIEQMGALGNSGEYLISGYSGDYNEKKMFITDSEFTDFKPIDFELENTDYVQSYYSPVPMADGTIFVNISTTDYGDIKIPKWDDPDFDSENFDYDAFYAAAQRTYRICTLDREGNVLADAEIKGIDKFYGDDGENDVYIGQVMPLGDSYIMSIGGMEGDEYYSLSADGTIGEKLDLGDRTYLYSAATDADGNIVFSSWDDGGEAIKTIDAKTKSLSKDVLKFSDLGIENNTQGLVAGIGDYRFFVLGTTNLYGVTNDNTAEEIVNWTDSDLNGQYIQSVIPLENSEFIVLERDWGKNGKTGVYRLTERDISELADTKIITLVTEWAGNDLLDMVKKFNQEHTDYRITVEDYQKYYEWDETSQKTINDPENQLKMDIAAGKTFDIMVSPSSSTLYTNLANKGMFIDLYELMDGSGLKKDDFVPNVLKACEFGGKLYKITPDFNVQTYAVKKKFVDKDSWTLDEMIEAYNGVSDKMRLFSYYDSKIDTFNLMFRSINGGFIDFEKGTCSFDSPEFVKLLEFIGGMDMDVDRGNYWETMTDEEMQQYYEERETALRNDKALVGKIYFSNAREYTRARYGEFGEDISLIGLPSDSGNGAVLNVGTAYSITANSPCKEACWEFINQFFSDDYYESQTHGNLPAVMTYLDKALDAAMQDPYWVDENGKKQTYKDSAWTGKESVDVPNISKDERDMIKEYILAADSSSFYYDEKIFSIINDEAQAFFAGEKTAKETADIIQNRVSIIVSEQS